MVTMTTLVQSRVFILSFDDKDIGAGDDLSSHVSELVAGTIWPLCQGYNNPCGVVWGTHLARLSESMCKKMHFCSQITIKIQIQVCQQQRS